MNRTDIGRSMKRYQVRLATAVLAAVAAVACCAAAAPGALGPVPAATTLVGWGLARPISAPGLHDAGISSLSCTQPGDCVAGGSGYDSGSIPRAFLVEEKGGVWGAATPVPGLAALSTGYTFVNAVSCASPGNCAAEGGYSGGGGAFVVDEANGTWGDAEELPGLTALGYAATLGNSEVSCTAAGDCAMTMTYNDHDGNPQVLVAQATGGVWSAAEALPGFAALDAVSGNRVDDYLSCPSTGNCAAVGTYVNASDHYEAFVASERNGTWSLVTEVPDLQLDTISCASVGNCVAAGQLGSNAEYVTDKNGAWAKPAQLPGIAVPTGHGDAAEIAGVSCPSAGDCAAVGTYYKPGSWSAFIDTETGGTWGRARRVPGLAALSLQGADSGLAVGCGSPGNCSVGGSYNFETYQRAFLAQETRGSWGDAQPVVGLAARGEEGQEAVTAISCGTPASCSAAGTFSPTGTNMTAPFVMRQVTLQPTATVLVLSASRISYGDEQAIHAAVAVSSAAGTAAGTVTVRSGSVTACTFTLSSATGSCMLPSTRFSPGSIHLTAVYGGGAGLAPSVSAPWTLTVVRAATTTRLRSSATKVTYGDEQADRLTITVIPRYARNVTGKATVKAGSVTVCVIRLKSSRTGSCRLPSKKLAPGTYQLVARYSGSADFTASASGKVTLRVAR